MSGAVVVFEAGKDSGEKEYRQHHHNEILNKSLLPLAIISLIAWAVLIPKHLEMERIVNNE